jgi:hypothetical protein
MDEFQRAKERSDRLIAKGRFKPPPAMSEPVQIRKEEQVVPALLMPKPQKGKVIVEIRVFVNDEPMVFKYSTEMRTHILASQLNYKWLSQKFKDMMKEWRVHDFLGSGQ